MLTSCFKSVSVTLLLVLTGCAADPPPVGAQTSATATAAALADRVRDYVYATYAVEAQRATGKIDGTAVASLSQARAALADEMTTDGLGAPDKDSGLVGVVRALAATFASHSDLVFLPLPQEAPGVAVVRVAERREVRDRALSGRTAAYRVVLFDEMPIEDFERWKGRGGPPRGSVASFSGSTVYLDRALARRIAREVVVPRVATVRALGPSVAAGKASRAEVKDVLRFAALDAAIGKGEEAIAAAILDAEETRVASLIACIALLPSERKPDTAAETKLARDAALVAIASGDPRYQMAAALATMLAGPGTPAAIGAEQAIAVIAATADATAQGPALVRLKPGEARARAIAALGR